MVLFAMTVVDSWHTFSACTGTAKTQNKYCSLLVEELIDNTYNAATGPSQNILIQDLDHKIVVLNAETSMSQGGGNSHTTPTKKRRRVNSEVSMYLEQG